MLRGDRVKLGKMLNLAIRKTAIASIMPQLTL